MSIPYELIDGLTAIGGAVPVTYNIGTNANAAILGSWPPIATVPAPLPTPAKRLVVACTQACNLWLLSLDMIIAQASGGYPPGLPAPIPLLANLVYTLDYPTCVLLYQSVAGGTLTIHAYA